MTELYDDECDGLNHEGIYREILLIIGYIKTNKFSILKGVFLPKTLWNCFLKR